MWGTHSERVRPPVARSLAVKAARVRADLAFAALDAFIVVGAYLMALAIRMVDPGVSGQYLVALMRFLPFLVLAHLTSNVVAGAYGHVWEHASIAEARQVIMSSLMVALAAGSFVVVQDPRPIPVSTVVMGAVFSMGGMGLVRFRSRMFSYRRLATGTQRVRTLVVGTGRAAASFVRESSSTVDAVGFISTTPTSHQRALAGLPILGSLEALVGLVEQYDVEQVVIAGGTDELVRSVVDLCLAVDVRLRLLPDVAHLMADRQAAVDVRDIEVTDLLPRAEIHTDLVAMQSVLEGKNVLVTGGGGSIGSEIVRQVLQHSPAAVVALDHDETLLHEMGLTLDERSLDVSSVLVDIRDSKRLTGLVRDFNPHVVFHAAALKHVPVLETHPDEAHKSNVVGTANVLAAVRGTALERFVLISTDKAVRPSSVMGASKRVAEMLVQQEGRRAGSGIYCSVRFGNVLGSRGSVVPTFVRQIKGGGPVTITDENMTRYFMTVDEAVQLVLQAAALADGGEVFVLDMGEQVRILDLARRMIRLAGLVPGRDVEIAYTGIRPGERLEEALAHGDLLPTRHPQLRLTLPPSPGPVTMTDFVDLLDELVSAGDLQGVREGLRDLATHEWDGWEAITLDTEDTIHSWT